MTQFVESIDVTNSRIDEEAGIVRGAKILGRTSANGREYSDKAMADAARLYEGAIVNIDHNRKEPAAERRFLEGFGELRGVTRTADGVFGDLHYLKTHPITPTFLERARKFPDKVGLSHNAEGQQVTRGGKKVVESITRVLSVDLVGAPATNRTLFESKNMAQEKTIASLLESSYPQTAKSSGVLEIPSIDTLELADGQDAAAAAFRAGLQGALIESLDIKASLAAASAMSDKFRALLGDDKQAKPAPVIESTDKAVQALQAELASMKKIEAARALLETHGMSGDQLLLESVLAMSDETAMTNLVKREAARSKEDKADVSRKPKPFVESVLHQAECAVPKDVKELASRLR